MSSAPSQVAGSTTRISNDEVRAVLHTHIRKTARFIKFLDLSVHLFSWVAAIFGLWLLACIVDHWLMPLPSLGRWLFWISAVAGTAWWLVTKLLPLLVRRINPAYAAKRIEHLLPEFKNGLISWLELDQLPENGVPRGIMSALTFRAARYIGGQDPSTTVDTSRLIKLIGVVLLLFMSLVVYTIVSPKSVLETGKRIAMPWRAIAAPSRVQILSVKPGAVELTQGKPLDVDVEVRGIRSNEAVRVRFTTTDGQLRDQRIELTPVTEGYHYSGKVRTETVGVEHELDYWVEAGDAISGPFRVSLSPLPSVVLDQVELKFPAYTKINDRKVRGGDFEAIEGTRATIHALANQKMSRGRWEINPEIDATGELLRADSVHELSVDDRQLTGTLLLQLNSEKENPTSLTYRLRGFNERGDGNREPIVHAMKVIADVAPEIKLVGPESRRVKVRPTSRLPLEVQSNDPDFGLTQIDIEIRRSGIVVLRETLLKSDGQIGQQIKRLSLNMADLRVSEGGTLEVRAIAYDNRHDPVSERLAPNSKESEPLTLEVVGADQTADPEEQMTSNEPATGDGASDKSQNNESNGSGSNPNSSNDRGNTDSTENEKSQASPNQNDASQEQPRQHENPSPADPSGNPDQGKQQGKKQENPGKQQDQQQSDQGNQQADQSKTAEGTQKPNPGQTGSGKQSATPPGKQEEQKGQQGSQSSGSESSDDGKQSGSKGGSDNGNQSTQPRSSQSGNDPSNSIGQKSTSPSPNSSTSDTGAKSESNTESGTPNGSGEENKPSDGEVVKRVQEIIQEKESQSNADARESEGPSSKSDSNNEKTTDGNKKDDRAEPDSARPGESTKTDRPESRKNDSTNRQDEKSDTSNSLGQATQKPAQSDTKSNPSDPNGKQSQSQKSDDQKSDDQKSADKNSQSKGTVGKSSEGKGSDGKDSDENGSDEKGSDVKGSNEKSTEGKGSDGKGSDGKGSDGKGSDGKGSDGKGSDGKGSDGKGSDGKGSDGKGSDGKGSDGKGSDGKGADGKGAEGKGSEEKGSDGKGSDGKGSDGKSSDGESSQSGTPSGSGEGGGKANGSKAGKSGTSGSGTGNGEGGGDGQADEANQDYANRTTQMVLDYLNRQKDQPDPELLRELNWTEEDLRKFTERWNKARNLAASPNPDDQKKWREMLEDLGLNRQMVKPSAARVTDDNFQQMRDSGNRIRPPENLRKQYEAFRRALEKSGK